VRSHFRNFSYLTGLCLSLFVAGCGGKEAVNEKDLVASYKDKHLTMEMLKHYMPAEVSEKDSARLADAFVKQWLKEQAVMDEALSYDQGLAQEVEYKVRDYKAKLIMHTYQQRIIEESLDKNVSNKEVIAFYEANKDNFVSRETLYNYFYIVTRNSSLNNAADWMRNGSTNDIQQLKEWAAENALESKLDSTYVGEAKIDIVSKGYYGNLQKTDPGKLIRWNGVIKGEKRFYLFKMIDVVREGEPLAVSLCKDKILDLILNERKVSLIEKNEERILKNARTNNSIKEY
jgi:hypothetical protein